MVALRNSWSLALVVIAACAAETPEDRVHSLLAHAQINCGERYQTTWQSACTPWSVPPAQAAACMNDALASGARAVLTDSWQDGELFVVDRYIFTIDHAVKVFDDHTDNPQHSGIVEQTCEGPFTSGTATCPILNDAQVEYLSYTCRY